MGGSQGCACPCKISLAFGVTSIGPQHTLVLAPALRYEAISVCSSVKMEDNEDTGSADDSGPSARGEQNEGETLEQRRPLTTTSLCIIKMHCVYMFVDPRQEGILACVSSYFAVLAFCAPERNSRPVAIYGQRADTATPCTHVSARSPGSRASCI